MAKITGKSDSLCSSQLQSTSGSSPLQRQFFSDGQVKQSLVRPEQPNPLEQLRKLPKRRTHFTTEQKHELNKIFAENCYPTSAVYSRLSRELSIPVYSLKHWFKNRRSRLKGSNTHSHTNPANRHIVISCGNGPAEVVSNSESRYYQAVPQYRNHPVYLSMCHSQPLYPPLYCYPAHLFQDVTACDIERQLFF